MMKLLGLRRKYEKDIFTLVLFPDFWPGYTGANPGYAMDKEK